MITSCKRELRVLEHSRLYGHTVHVSLWNSTSGTALLQSPQRTIMNGESWLYSTPSVQVRTKLPRPDNSKLSYAKRTDWSPAYIYVRSGCLGGVGDVASPSPPPSIDHNGGTGTGTGNRAEPGSVPPRAPAGAYRR